MSIIEILTSNDPFGTATMIVAGLTVLILMLNIGVVIYAMWLGRILAGGHVLSIGVMVLAVGVSSIYVLYYVQIARGVFTPQIHGPALLRPANIPLFLTYAFFSIMSVYQVYQSAFRPANIPEIILTTKEEIRAVFEEVVDDRLGDR